MLRFSIFGYPVEVHWLFWLTMAFLGGGVSANTPFEWTMVLLWIAAAFLSILVHELGHAVVASRYGARCAIFLHGLGGLTTMHGLRVTRVQSILISLAGPGAGFALGIVFLVFYPFLAGLKASWLSVGVNVLFSDLVQINLFWSLFNLLPVLPMDGGQVLRDLLGPQRIRIACGVSAVIAGVFCGLALLFREWFLVIFFAYLAYANFKRLPVEGGTTMR